MGERSVEDAALAVHLGPRQRVVTVRVRAGVARLHAQTEQHVDLVARVLARLVELVVEVKRGRKMLRRREGRVLVDHHPGSGDRVSVEARPDQLAELRPGLERGQTDVRCHEAMAVANELQELVLLRRIERHIAMAGKENRVHVGEVRSATGGRAVGLLRALRNDVRVGADERVPHAGLVAEPLDGRQRMADRIVLRLAVAGVGPREHAFSRWAAAAAPRAATGPLACAWSLLSGGGEPGHCRRTR